MNEFVDIQAIEQKAAADWQRDPKLREEFDGDFESFKAFRRADAAGIVRILGEQRETRK